MICAGDDSQAVPIKLEEEEAAETDCGCSKGLSRDLSTAATAATGGRDTPSSSTSSGSSSNGANDEPTEHQAEATRYSEATSTTADENVDVSTIPEVDDDDNGRLNGMVRVESGEFSFGTDHPFIIPVGPVESSPILLYSRLSCCSGPQPERHYFVSRAMCSPLVYGCICLFHAFRERMGYNTRFASLLVYSSSFPAQ